MNVKIVVALHKAYPVPDSDLYLPVQVGEVLAARRLPVVGDGTGDNISAKNALYCELTGLYWAWKNVESDSLGLAHYRRHFAGSRPEVCSWKQPEGTESDGSAPAPRLPKRADRVLGADEAADLLERHPVLLPRKRHYYVESVGAHYAHAHGGRDLELARRVLKERDPGALPHFEEHLASTSGHICNMFVMRRDLADSYCAWLFDVLFRVEEEYAGEGTTPPPRAMGFLGERLLDVWLASRGMKYAELPVIHLESQHWPTKIFRFLARKFGRPVRA